MSNFSDSRSMRKKSAAWSGQARFPFFSSRVGPDLMVKGRFIPTFFAALNTHRLSIAMASLTWKLYLLFSFVAFMATYLFGNYFDATLSGPFKGHMHRVIVVFKAEIIMSLFSIFAYKRIMSLLEPLATVKRHDDAELAIIENEAKLAPYRSVVSVMLILWLIMAHMMYYLYFFPAWMQFLLFDLSAISLGIWTYTVAFLFGFSLVNFFARLFLKVRWIAVMLKPLTDIKLINDLTLNARFQTKVALCVSAVVCLVTFISCDKVVVKKIAFDLKDTPQGAKGMRMGLITDLHIGATVGGDEVNKVVEIANQQQFDAVFIVGDLTDGTVDVLLEYVQPLRHLTAKYGVYFVTGNHDYYFDDIKEWLLVLNNLGIHVLRNDHVDLNGICLVGLDDISASKSGAYGHEMNVKKAITGCANDRPIITLAHNPVSARNITLYREPRPVDLILSGHIHAGQFYVVVPMVLLTLPYFYGVYHFSSGAQMLVSAGTLYQGPPFKMVDDNRVGQKLLEGMGWCKGKGLGANEQGLAEAVKLKSNNETRGLGAKNKCDETWMAHHDAFADLLTELNAKKEDTATCETTAASTAGCSSKGSIESLAKKTKSRMHYQKFVRGKDLTKYSANDKVAVLGSRKRRRSTDIDIAVVAVPNDSCSILKCSSDVSEAGTKTHTSTLSVQDYFTAKMKALKRNQTKVD